MSKASKNSHFKQKLNLTNPIHLLAVGLGSGVSPIMPGTVGSLMAIPLWFLFNGLPPLLYWVFIVVAFVFGCYICQKTSNDTQTHDSGHIVWDEFVGMWITLFFIPQVTWLWLLIAFVAFRLFDIVKPFPIGWFDKQVSGGLGIMLDDVIAGLFSSVLVIALSYLW
ncbi:phosphatidylglycerophosphatase A [Orbaceae bacterium ac157xtp]